MKIEIKVPAMGESISEATVGAFIKPEGSYVKADEELLELETDKVNQVLYAPQAGIVSWKVSEGETVKIGQTLGTVEEGKEPQGKQEPGKQAAKPEGGDQNAKQVTKPLSKVEAKEEAAKPDLSPAETKQDSFKQTSAGARFGKDQFLFELKEESQPKSGVLSSPASSSKGSEQKQIFTHARPTEKSETRKKMSKIRKVIASRLVDVLQQTAMLTTFNEADMTKIVAMREAYKESFAKQYQARLGFMAFFVKAVVAAMKQFPEINAYIDGDEIVYRNYYDIGVAVGTDKGLFVPVIRNCDTLSFADIERAIESFALKAREGTLSAADLQGGGFTITNGGTYGSLLSTPILNPPQSAILGMHKIMKRPVVVDDQIVIRQMMYLALSYDHRVVDGKEAVSFLVQIKNALEDPSRMLIGI